MGIGAVARRNPAARTHFARRAAPARAPEQARWLHVRELRLGQARRSPSGGVLRGGRQGHGVGIDDAEDDARILRTAYAGGIAHLEGLRPRTAWPVDASAAVR